MTDSGWLKSEFRFTEDDKKIIFANVKLGDDSQRDKFIRTVEGLIRIVQTAVKPLPRDVLMRRAKSELPDLNAKFVVDQLKLGGKPTAENKVLALWISEAYFHCFSKRPSFNSGTIFENLLDNISKVSPVKLPNDPRLLRPTK